MLTALMSVPLPAKAADARIHVLDFNACDQFEVDGAVPDCAGNTPGDRGVAIAASIESWPAEVATLQEVCESTFNTVLANLPNSWSGKFYRTVTLDSEDDRCMSVERKWGLGIITRGTPFVNLAAHFLGYDPDGEVRRLFCADTFIVTTFTVCSSHLNTISTTPDADENRVQFANLRNLMNNMAVNGEAAILGADLNRNNRVCGTSSIVMLQTLYFGSLGGGTVGGCAYGSGNYFEADHYTGAAGDTFDESTLGTLKVDYVFINRQRTYANYGADATMSAYSDHDPVRGSVTVRG